MENVEAFIDQLIDEKGYSTLDEAARAELRQELLQRLLDQIDRAAVDALSEEKAEELSAKLDDPNFTNDDASRFMQESGVDLQEIALTTMLQFRALYIGDDAADAIAENNLARAAAESTAGSATSPSPVSSAAESRQGA